LVQLGASESKYWKTHLRERRDQQNKGRGENPAIMINTGNKPKCLQLCVGRGRAEVHSPRFSGKLTGKKRSATRVESLGITFDT